MLRFLILSSVLITAVSIGLILDAQAEENIIPEWIKGTAEFWINGSIGDSEFIRALQFMITNDIIHVPEDPRIQELEKENKRLSEGLAALTSEIKSEQKSDTKDSSPMFSIDVMSCTEYGTNSIKIQASLKNNDSVTHSPEMIFYLHDENMKVVSFWEYTERNLAPGQMVFIEGYPDVISPMTGCGLKILKNN